MERGLAQLRQLQKETKAPVFIAGDIFDSWKEPAAVVNFALKCLPKQCYAIPGQHDLPFHRWEDIRKSPFWTLVEAGKIHLLHNDPSFGDEFIYDDGELEVRGFPWGHDITRMNDEDYDSKKWQVALCHQYVWMKGHSYPDAPTQQFAGKLTKRIARYNWAVFGDNHKGFIYSTGIVNCGGFFRRKADEINYQPAVYLLSSKGDMIPWVLDVSEDVFAFKCTEIETPDGMLDLSEFLDELTAIGAEGLDYVQSIRQFINKHKVHKRTAHILLAAVENARTKK